MDWQPIETAPHGENSPCVLLIDKDGDHSVGYWAQRQWVMYETGTPFAPEIIITHWMPLPAAPVT